jgi:hypothetical protein
MIHEDFDLKLQDANASHQYSIPGPNLVDRQT